MTVAAVIVVPSSSIAQADAEGLPGLRRIVQAAWAGGAMPVVVVARPGPAAEPLRSLLDGLPASLILPEGVPQGSGLFGAGFAAALSQVRETAAALLWPCPYAWVDPETVTSLIEAHGATPDMIVQASFHGRMGVPILVPAAHVARFQGEPRMHAFDLVDLLVFEGSPLRSIELGDPGIVNDVTVPRSKLPPYQGPPEPASGMPPEWNEELARHAEPAPAPEPAPEI